MVFLQTGFTHRARGSIKALLWVKDVSGCAASCWTHFSQVVSTVFKVFLSLNDSKWSVLFMQPSAESLRRFLLTAAPILPSLQGETPSGTPVSSLAQNGQSVHELWEQKSRKESDSDTGGVQGQS